MESPTRPPADLAELVTVVLLTHNCASWVEPTLERLLELGVPLVAVDNGSRDRTPELLERPGVERVLLERNIGAAGRNVGATRARTPYVAFCDDDGWYEREGLLEAVRVLEEHPRLGLVNARILVGDECRLDPISAEMAQSPLPSDDVPGHPLLGFMAGAAVVRRTAFEDVGGYDPRFFIGGEEETVALPLARRGWLMTYVPTVVVRHYPSRVNAPRIRHYGVRNTLVTAWLHRPAGRALSWTWFIARTTPSRTALLRGLGLTVTAVPWILRERSVVASELDHALALLERRRRAATPGRGRSARAVW